MLHLDWMQSKLRPRMIFSENVVSGNINQRICEKLQKEYDAQVPCFVCILC